MKTLLNKVTTTLIAGACLASAATAGGDPNVNNRPVVNVLADINVDTTWTCDNVYNLTQQIYVDNGACLTIEAGTVIASAPSANGAGSLAITKGSTIMACGTKDEPIIFTTTNDTATWVNGDFRQGAWRVACSEWGNISILGCAYMNTCSKAGNTDTCDPNNCGVLEGLVEAFPGDPRVLYGGGDDEDDSGKLEYVSLRYGGRVVGLTNELNGLSLGAVGRGTDINHVDIMNNVDDGIEIFGGTVNIKYANIWNIGDDSFDIDQGYRGKVQFVCIVQGYSCVASQGSGVGDNCFEIDGAETSERQPVTTTAIYNATVVGQPASGDHATAWRDNARVQYRNCIFMDIGDDLVRFDNVDGDPCGTGYGFGGTLSWADTWTTLASNTSIVNPCPNPAARYTAQDPTGFLAELRECCFFNVADVAEATARGVFTAPFNNATVASLPIASLTRAADENVLGLVQRRVIGIDPRAVGTMAAPSAPDDGFYCNAPYKGAFDPNECDNWLRCWTAADHFGYVDPVPEAVTTARNAGANPNSYTASLFELGQPFTLTVDLTTTGHSLAQPFGFDTAFTFTLGGGQTVLCLDLGGSGELLGLPFMVGPTAVFNGVVPNNIVLCGFQLCTQVIHFGGVVPFALSNANDLTVGV